MGELVSYLRKELSDCYTAGELEGVVWAICEDLLAMPRNQMLFATCNDLSPNNKALLEEALKRLAAGEPIQYVTGIAVFRGMKLKVTPHTLIPRPETTGIVDIANEMLGGRHCRILDLCTGSGCIAIAMARENTNWDVTGIDISQEAIEVARHNAKAYGAQVAFETRDMFAASYPEGSFDMVTCNPPYVMQSEKATMHRRVTEHEPATALFVPDDDPLLFHRAAATKAMEWLKDKGTICLEINSKLHRETAQLLEKSGYRKVEARKDYIGNFRFIKAEKP